MVYVDWMMLRLLVMCMVWLFFCMRACMYACVRDLPRMRRLRTNFHTRNSTISLSTFSPRVAAGLQLWDTSMGWSVPMFTAFSRTGYSRRTINVKAGSSLTSWLTFCVPSRSVVALVSDALCWFVLQLDSSNELLCVTWRAQGRLIKADQCERSR